MARGILQQSQAEVETKLHVAVGQAGRGCCDLDHSLCTAVPVGTIGPVHRTCSLKAQDSDCTQVLNERTICLYYAYIYIHMIHAFISNFVSSKQSRLRRVPSRPWQRHLSCLGQSG